MLTLGGARGQLNPSVNPLAQMDASGVAPDPTPDHESQQFHQCCGKGLPVPLEWIRLRERQLQVFALHTGTDWVGHRSRWKKVYPVIPELKPATQKH